jgi:hypothetical protein
MLEILAAMLARIHTHGEASYPGGGWWCLRGPYPDLSAPLLLKREAPLF